MIKISGVVTVKTINGRNGPFNVGRLVTEIGEFAVKEGIEEYDPGQYEGDFAISRIYQASYAIGGRTTTEVPSGDEALFGELWPLGEKVKLDPTVDREVLRRQSARLKELGYQFQPVGRVFMQAAH